MKQVLHYLSLLGFSDVEAKLYIKLLTSGPMTVAKLAEATKMSAAYDTVS